MAGHSSARTKGRRLNRGSPRPRSPRVGALGLSGSNNCPNTAFLFAEIWPNTVSASAQRPSRVGVVLPPRIHMRFAGVNWPTWPLAVLSGPLAVLSGRRALSVNFALHVFARFALSREYIYASDFVAPGPCGRAEWASRCLCEFRSLRGSLSGRPRWPIGPARSVEFGLLHRICQFTRQN